MLRRNLMAPAWNFGKNPATYREHAGRAPREPRPPLPKPPAPPHTTPAPGRRGPGRNLLFLLMLALAAFAWDRRPMARPAAAPGDFLDVAPLGRVITLHALNIEAQVYIADDDICREIHIRSHRNPVPVYGVAADGSMVLTWRKIPGQERHSERITDTPNRFERGFAANSFLRYTGDSTKQLGTTRSNSAAWALRRGASQQEQVAYLRGRIFELQGLRDGAKFSAEILKSVAFMERKLPTRLPTVEGRFWARLWLPFLAAWTAPELAASPNDIVWQDAARRLEGLRQLVVESGYAEVAALFEDMKHPTKTRSWQEGKAATRVLAQKLTADFPEDARYVDAILRLGERGEKRFRREAGLETERRPSFAAEIAVQEEALLASLWTNTIPKVFLEVLGPKAGEAGIRPEPSIWIWPLPAEGNS